MAANIHAVTIPKLGLTMEEGSVSAWHVEPGATVKEGAEVADIETEKVTTPCEAPVSGTWKRTIATVGKSLPVGALIGVIADADVSDVDIDAFVNAFMPSSGA